MVLGSQDQTCGQGLGTYKHFEKFSRIQMFLTCEFCTKSLSLYYFLGIINPRSCNVKYKPKTLYIVLFFFVSFIQTCSLRVVHPKVNARNFVVNFVANWSEQSHTDTSRLQLKFQSYRFNTFPTLKTQALWHCVMRITWASRDPPVISFDPRWEFVVCSAPCKEHITWEDFETSDYTLAVSTQVVYRNCDYRFKASHEMAKRKPGNMTHYAHTFIGPNGNYEKRSSYIVPVDHTFPTQRNSHLGKPL